MWKCLLVDLVKECCNLVNMHIGPYTDGVMLRSISRSLIHLRSDVVWDVLEMNCSTASTLACLMGRRRRNWDTVSRFHPITVF